MARLVPEDHPTALIDNKSERAVVEVLQGISDSWFIISNLSFVRDGQTHEIDVVLLHPAMGVVIIEVKGWVPIIRKGEWLYADGSRPDRKPIHQARDNSFALRDHLRRNIEGLRLRRVPFAVAFPEAAEVRGKLPESLEACNLILGPDLDQASLLEDKVEILASSAPLLGGFGEDTVNAILKLLAPDADFTWDADSEHRRARLRLQQLTEQQVEALVSLEDNRRVVVRGGAGTGKTRLARQWVRHAVQHREERVLLTCYNDPLGEYFQAEFEDWGEVLAGPFLRLIRELPGIPVIAPPAGATKEEITRWWNETLPEHVLANLMSVPIRFDMVVVDEAQDFAPRWIGLLEALLDRDGPGRMLLLGDERQVVYRRGFVLPDVDDGWVTATMPRNCRNAHVIATLLRRKLGGAAPALAAPPGWGYRFVEEDNAGSIPGLVADVVDSWLADGREPSNIGVVTTSTALREAIEKRGGFATDPKDGDNLVRVGTAHRLKGLEFDSVVLAADSPAPAEALLYVGVSRARSELVVIGPGGLGEQLGWSEGDDTAEGAPG